MWKGPYTFPTPGSRKGAEQGESSPQSVPVSLHGILTPSPSPKGAMPFDGVGHKAHRGKWLAKAVQLGSQAVEPPHLRLVNPPWPQGLGPHLDLSLDTR